MPGLMALREEFGAARPNGALPQRDLLERTDTLLHQRFADFGRSDEVQAADHREKSSPMNRNNI
jgi:hypothetical protein